VNCWQKQKCHRGKKGSSEVHVAAPHVILAETKERKQRHIAKCYTCGKNGHYAATCWQKQEYRNMENKAFTGLINTGKVNNKINDILT